MPMRRDLRNSLAERADAVSLFQKRGGRLKSGPLACPLEHDEQVALFAWADLAKGRYPELDEMVAVPNGGYRSIKTARALKAEGVKAGYPDILLDVPKGDYHGLRIEMKRQKGGQVSASQVLWRDRLIGRGYCVHVCKGFLEAKTAILAYLSL